MTNVKHTPAPWKFKPVHGDANRQLILDGNGSGNWIAEIRQNGEILEATQQANARLIAAAPELLEAAYQALQIISSNTFLEIMTKKEKEAAHNLRKAINKAEGR